jgi:hypothetical protein
MASWNFIRRCQSNQIQTFTAYSLSTRGPPRALAKTQLLFPISHELAMIGAFEMRDEERDTDVSHVAQINGSIFLRCMRQVYARDGGFPYKLNHNAEIRRGDQLLDDPGLFGRALPEVRRVAKGVIDATRPDEW